MKTKLIFIFIGVMYLFFSCNRPYTPSLDISRNNMTELLLTSPDSSLVEIFNWAMDRSHRWVGDDNDPVGPWYEAALPNRDAFCMRDVAHQSIGEEINGHGKQNLNMMARFMENISASKDFCSYWEINKYNLPAPVDYESDDDFWYNLPANFDVIDACYRLYLWTGNEAYISDSQFVKFRELTLNNYVERWQLQPDKIMQRPAMMNVKNPPPPNQRFIQRRGIPSYNEGTRGIRVGSDLISNLYKGFMASSKINEILKNNDLAEKYANLANEYRDLYNTIWWNEETHSYYSQFLESGFSGSGGGNNSLISKPERIALSMQSTATTAGGGRNQAIEGLSAAPLNNYKNGYYDRAYAAINLIFINERRDYPEGASGLIEGVVCGMMGVYANVVENTVSSLPRLTEATPWVAIENIPTFAGPVSVLHESNSKSAFANKSNKEVIWRATFDEDCKYILHRGKKLEARHYFDVFGNIYSYIDIVCAPGSLEFAEAVHGQFNQIGKKYDDNLSSDFKNGGAWVENQDGLKNRVNTKGQFMYDRVYYDYKIQSYGDLTRYYVKIDKTMGIIDEDGIDIIPPVYDNLAYNVRFPGYLQARKGNKEGYINFSNEIVMPFSFDMINIVSFVENRKNDIIARFSQNGKFGFIDFNEKVLIPAEYEDADFYRDGRGNVKRNGKWGIVDINNTTIVPFQYDRIWTEDEIQRLYATYYYVEENRRLGIINIDDGKVIVPALYDEFIFSRLSSNFIGIKKDNKTGYLDLNGNVVFSAIYDDILIYRNRTIAKFRKGDKWGFVEPGDKIIIPAEYDDAGAFDQGLAPVRQGDKWGFVDETGKVIVPFLYDTIRQDYGGNHYGEIAMVEGDGKTYWIDNKGKATEYISK